MELQSTEEETAQLLSRVLNGNMLASEALAKVVHEDVDLTDPTLESLEISIPQEILGIWVDPIGKCGAAPCAFSHSFQAIVFFSGLREALRNRDCGNTRSPTRFFCLFL